MSNLTTWMESRKAPLWVDVIRIIAGLLIVYKGIVFMNNMDAFSEDISSVGWIYIAAHLAQVIIFVHLVCGTALLFGGYTRLMSLINLPILAGAVVFNFKKLLMAENSIELSVSFAVLVILVIVFLMGGGEWSLDYKRKK